MSLKDKYSTLRKDFDTEGSNTEAVMAALSYPLRCLGDRLLITFNSAESNDEINKTRENKGVAKIGDAKVFSLD